jgi:hypothetical protein
MLLAVLSESEVRKKKLSCRSQAEVDLAVRKLED